jgi:hypothetical protein
MPNEAVDTLVGQTEDSADSLITYEMLQIPKIKPRPSFDYDINPTGRVQSPLTGLWISEDAASSRPIVVVLNNMFRALPMSGVSQADIMYEVLSEGDITRMLGVFQDLTTERLGTVRSTRMYFTDIALDYDAILVHHGGSVEGYAAIRNNGVTNIDGMSSWNAFFRDQDRARSAGLEHSSYTSISGITAEIERRNIRTENEIELERFEFYNRLTAPPDSETVTKITIPFSANYRSTFEFDRGWGVYHVTDGRGSERIDEETDTQLSFANIIVMFTDVRLIPGDRDGKRTVRMTGEGTGILYTNGTASPILWSRTTNKSQTKWTDTDGNTLILNRGKTYIGIVDTTCKIITE